MNVFFLLFLRYFPYGVDGMLTGSATVFFAYIGFDTVASMAEEVSVIYYCSIIFSSTGIYTYIAVSYAGEKSPAGFTARYWDFAPALLFAVHDGVCCYCWFSAVLCYGP